jgi:hypothetical protein
MFTNITTLLNIFKLTNNSKHMVAHTINIFPDELFDILPAFRFAARTRQILNAAQEHSDRFP